MTPQERYWIGQATHDVEVGNRPRRFKRHTALTILYLETYYAKLLAEKKVVVSK